MFCPDVKPMPLDELLGVAGRARRGDEAARRLYYCAVYVRHRRLAWSAACEVQFSWYDGAVAHTIHYAATDATAIGMLALELGRPLFPFTNRARQFTQHCLYARALGVLRPDPWSVGQVEQISAWRPAGDRLAPRLAELEARLGPEDAEIIRRYVIGESFEEIARAVNAPIATIRSGCYRALDTYCGYLGDRWR